MLNDEKTQGQVELIVNGKVLAAKKGSSEPGKPLTLTTTLPINESVWIAARSMKRGEHVTHTAPVWITFNNQPVKPSKEDISHFVSWIDELLRKTDAGGEWRKFFPTSIDTVRQRYQQARAVYIAKANRSVF